MTNDPSQFEQELSSTQIADLFRVAAEPRAPAVQASDVKQRLTERAAVMGSFVPAELLAGIERTEEATSALEEVLQESVIVAQGGARRWLLEPRARVSALSRLGTNARALLDQVKRERSDGFGEALASLIREQVPDATQLSTETLRSLVPVGEWLRESSKLAADKLPLWRAELKHRQLVQPLKDVIGGRFVGRQKDMAKLRDFADVVPPDGRFDGWSRWLSNMVYQRKEPLVVHGIGGIGKSTLMAQFILTHAAVSSERGFPFAYIDFDRLCLDPNNPAMLLIEVLDQVGAQFVKIAPQLDAFASQIRQDMEHSRIEQHARSRATESAAQVVDHSFVARATSAFVSLMSDTELGSRPFLLVLDTFEEVQVRGESAVDSVFRWLDSMYQLDHLRVVISGRAPVEDRKIARHVALGNFDKVAAMSFLQDAQLAPEIAAEIFDKVGGNPLALRLCIRIAQQNGLDSVKKKDLEGLLGKRDGAYIQGYLYTRLLRHIGDKTIEALAHPGLVLRRITPDIILRVLGPVVGLEVASPEAAEKMYQSLRREVSLVTEEDGALIHRKDVRSVMLGMQRADDTATFVELNRRAAAYYMGLEPQTSISRLEATYHRLMLDEEDPFKVVAEIRREELPSLGTSIDELPTKARSAVRALLGQGLTRGEVKTLPDKIWTAYAYRRAMALVAAGSPDDALAIFEDRRDAWQRSILVYPRALALFNKLDWSEAARSLTEWAPGAELDQSYFGFTTAEKTELRIRPLIERGHLLWYQGQESAARMSFAEAQKHANSRESSVLRVESQLGLLVTLGDKGSEASGRNLQRALDEVTREGWRSNLVTLRRVLFLGFAEPELVRVAVSHLGIQLRTAGALREFQSRFGPRLSTELVEMLQRITEDESRLSNKAELSTLERLAAAEIAKPAVEATGLSAGAFVRGRFAPWKIPARSALLASYGERGGLEEMIGNLLGGAWHAALRKSRTVRALADALIELADEKDRFVETMAVLLTNAPQPSLDAHLLLKALNLYSRQMERYQESDGYATA